jgi:two-component system phosphate regulon sensor histidine kinase PhoR
MQNQASRMDALISDLLALSKLEMEREAPRDRVVQIADLLDTIVMEANTLSGASAHQFEIKTDRSINIRGAEGELRSAFSNLIFNAVKHTPGGSLIQVTWHQTNTGAELNIIDSGEGIAARHIPRLTERFYRIDAGRSRQAGGTGLGLSIAKHSLSRHGASLQIQSRVGHGSTFSCRFPAERLQITIEAAEAPGNEVQESA